MHSGFTFSGAFKGFGMTLAEHSKPDGVSGPRANTERRPKEHLTLEIETPGPRLRLISERLAGARQKYPGAEIKPGTWLEYC